MIKKKKAISSKKLSELVIESIKQKKGRDIVSINFKKIPNAISDYFIICHGTSSTQVEAIADNVYKVLREKGAKPWHTEGKNNAEWILIDYVDVVVHIFIDSARNFYRIEDLWADAELINYANEE